MDEFNLWLSGKTFTEIAELTGRAKCAVTRTVKLNPRYEELALVRKKEYKPRPNTRQDINSDLSKEIASLYSEGLSMEKNR